MKVVDTLEVCETCMLYVAGYDNYELGLPDVTTLAYVGGIAGVNSAYAEYGPVSLVNDSDSEPYFSKRECDICRSKLAGLRYAVAVMARDTSPHTGGWRRLLPS